MAEEDVEIIRRGYEAFNRDGPESIYQWLDPEVEWRNPPESTDRNVWRGHEGVATGCWSCAAPSSAPAEAASRWKFPSRTS